ncbi:amino acid adenylation domain-containing protein [Actinoplanes sp. GCM10030250]|uniref:non-ribosomal peptide synthetase n=1 Tax=Actinoplanes sp. GCM10030250 TaxID=3273376 RepID=UPI00360FBE20
MNDARKSRDLIPASRKEEALWLLERLAPGSAPNNLALAFRVAGRIDTGYLAAAVSAMLRRHEVLRTVHFTDGTGLTKTVLSPDEAEVPVAELPGPAAGALPGFVGRPFTLDGRPLLRAAVFHDTGGDVVCLVFHHLVYDTISGTVLLEELAGDYERLHQGRTPELTPVPPYAEPEPADASLDFWRTQLTGFDPSTLELRYGRRQPDQPSLTGDQVSHVLAAETRAGVKRLQKQLRAPEAVVLLAAYYLLLSAHGAGPDITVGSPVNVRAPEHTRAIGYLVNVLPMRVEVDPAQSFRALVRRTRDMFFASLTHAGVPVDSISGLVPRVNSSWRSTLFHHLFNYVPQLGLPGFTLGGLDAEPIVVENGFSKFDLEFFVMASAEQLRVLAVHSTAMFSTGEVTTLLHRYEALLRTLADGTGDVADRPVRELPVWSEHDREVIGAANRTGAPVDPGSVLAAVAGHARTAPGSVAVEAGDRTATYGQIWDAAVRTRDCLTEAGVAHGDVVALLAARGPELVAAVLGIWLAGAAYLPIDPEHPAQRIAYLLTDSGTPAVLADRAVTLPEGHRAKVLPLAPVTGSAATPREDEGRADPAAIAYLIYTSGSTGHPKGTLITHGGLANTAAHFTAQLGARPSDTTLWTTTFAFDMSGIELHVPLYSGGRIAIAPDEARVDGKVLAEFVERHEPGILEATPTTWRLVLDEVRRLLPGRRIVIGGEPVPAELAGRLVAAGAQVHHAYGPTETTIWSTSAIVGPDPGDRLDVGRPIRNTRVLVVAPDGRRLPVGVRGELWIAGAGVAAGYHNRPGLTAERFADDPEYGRCYRTGDVGWWRPDGTLELAGRVDRQIKLRGNRIELGEVEAVLGAHPGVRAAAVVATGDLTSDGRLVAFVVPAGGTDVPAGLWEHARGRLPRSAVPHEFTALAELPVSTNQKVDHLALERAAAEARGPQPTGAPAGEPGDALTTALTELWWRVLDRPDLHADSNFFSNGGHSLLGVQLLQLVEDELGTVVKLADFFAAPTPRALAAHIHTIDAPETKESSDDA